MADSFELLVLSFISPIFSTIWSLSKFEEAGIVSVGFLGFFFGAMFWGMIADKFGRKRAYVFVLLSLLVVGYAQMASFDYILCLFFRFAMGFCVGGRAQDCNGFPSLNLNSFL
jgi:putative MFS transporter